MNRISFLLIYVLLLITYGCADSVQQNAPEINKKQFFDNDWKFHLGDEVDAQSIDFDDASWRKLDLPHDWSIEGTIDQKHPAGNDGGYMPTGIGWYRKTFQVPESWDGKKVSIYFEGVYMNSEVFINGESLGVYPYGYSSFYYDLTPHLKVGSENKLAVRVDNSQQKNCRWYSGSGIYRHVWLYVAEPIHIEPWGLAITTPDISNENASVQLKTLVINETESQTVVSVQSKIIDQEGTTVATEKVKISLEANSQQEIAQLMTVKNPLLWTPETPNLYTAQISIKQQNTYLDQTTCNFGIRSISYTSEDGFLLNGEQVVLNGGCVHHDNGCLGAAAFDRAEQRKIELLKEAGFNAVRTSHNPPSEAFLDACDRIGLLVIDEAFDGWREQKMPHDYASIFDEWWKTDVQAMVLRDRNHPSIIMWSIGNEIIERTKPEAVETAKKLAEAIREVDSTRPITSAMTSWNQGWEIFDPLMAEHDICGYNYMLHLAESDHERVPNRVILQTESYPKDAFYCWNMVQKHPYIIGDFVWTAMDYLGESGIGRWFYSGETPGEHWVQPLFPWHAAYCGDIDLTGWRKPISHYRSMLYNDTEKLYMAVREPEPLPKKIHTTMWSVWPTWESWTWPGHEGKNIEVEIYSKYEKVRLYLNDSLIGEQETAYEQEFKAIFTLKYQQGTLKAVGMFNNEEVETFQLETAGKTSNINLTYDRANIIANGQDLAFITVELCDDNYNINPNANNRFYVEIEGPGVIQGIDNGDIKDLDPYVSNNRKAFHGRALVVVRSTHEEGTILIKAHIDSTKSFGISISSN